VNVLLVLQGSKPSGHEILAAHRDQKVGAPITCTTYVREKLKLANDRLGYSELKLQLHVMSSFS